MRQHNTKTRVPLMRHGLPCQVEVVAAVAKIPMILWRIYTVILKTRRVLNMIIVNLPMLAFSLDARRRRSAERKERSEGYNSATNSDLCSNSFVMCIEMRT